MRETNDRLKSLRPQWVGKSQINVTVRRIGDNPSIVVTVVSTSPLSVNARVAGMRDLHAAEEAAIRYGATSTDCSSTPTAERRCYVTGSDGKRIPYRLNRRAFFFATAV